MDWNNLSSDENDSWMDSDSDKEDKAPPSPQKETTQP